jgi:hexosaminidase
MFWLAAGFALGVLPAAAADVAEAGKAVAGDPAATAAKLAAADVWLLAPPKRAEMLAGSFDLAQCRGIRWQGLGELLARPQFRGLPARLHERSGVLLPSREGPPEDGCICVVLLPDRAAALPHLPGVPAADLQQAIAQRGYVVSVESQRVVLAAGGATALLAAQQTLLQLAADRSRLPAMRLVDWPSLRWRGVQQDISRGQVPTPASLVRLAEVAAEAKINMLELYLEHVFQFPSHPDISPPEGLTPQECRELFDRAAAVGVEVHPLFQTLGHAEQILGKPKYAHLRIPPSGKGPTTMTWDIRKPEAIAMMGRLVDDLCRAMPGRIFGVDITEVDYEGLLSGGASPKEVTEIVFRYVLALRDMVRRHNMRLLVSQGPLDSVGHLSGLGPKLDQLPRDVIVGSYYCAGGPYQPAWEKDFPRLHEKGFDFFAQAWIYSHLWLTPWVNRAAEFSDLEVSRGLKHGAIGSITCDWGDAGHFHFVGEEWLPYL